MTRWWAQLPTGRVVCLDGADRAALAADLEVLPEDAPAIIAYSLGHPRSLPEMVGVALDTLERAAVDLFPAWLPDAAGLTRPARRGGPGARAVRMLALRLAARSPHFGPFLAELAETALCDDGDAATSRSLRRFPREVRAAGLARVLAASYGRTHTAILLEVPDGLTPSEEELLVAGAEWLAHAGGFGVWLTRAPLTAVDRLETVPVLLPYGGAHDTGGAAPWPPVDDEPTVTFPAVAGKPHPASRAEQLLETALAKCPWATGRAWNQTYQSDPLTPPIRVDLIWRAERCVVEVDGDDHRRPLKFRADRRRDVQLQLDGYAVLRFTDDQVLDDVQAVVHQIGRFIEKRRRARHRGTLEG